jgi:hypothetical protein
VVSELNQCGPCESEVYLPYHSRHTSSDIRQYGDTFLVVDPEKEIDSAYLLETVIYSTVCEKCFVKECMGE